MRPKLTKASGATTTFTVDFTELLGSADTIATINSITGSSALTITSPTILVVAINTPTGYDDRQYFSHRYPFHEDRIKTTITIAEGKGIQFTIAGGINNTEYPIVINITSTLGNQIIITVILIISNISTDTVNGIPLTTLNYYGSVVLSQDYFASNGIWTSYLLQQQLAALIQASRAIDNLNYTGLKTIKTQPQEFPRDFDIDVPTNIDYACYEEALLLIQGISPNDEQVDLSTISEGIGSAKITYDRAWIPENIRSGIMSNVAWTYLKPYLRDPLELTLSRVN